MTPWWTSQQAGLIGGIAGSVVGVLGGIAGTLAGTLAPRGKARRLVMGLFVSMLAVGVEQIRSTVSPFLIARTTKCLFETLGSNLDQIHALLGSREFGDRLCLDRFKARTKPARGAFQ